jgi:ATP-dependent Clp protease ATP-binding subunit ClpC
MFERFSDRARRLVVQAQEEARRLNHSFIGPEHLLLALVEGDGTGPQALQALGVSLESVRHQIVERTGTGAAPASPGHIPFKGAAKKVLELSLREALSLGHNYIGTEHILLGLLREGESDADSVVHLLGVDIAQVRAQVVALGGEARGGDASWSPALGEAERRARQAARPGPVTTGQVLVAMLADRSSQAAKALEALGVTEESLEAQLAQVPLRDTSDAPPVPRSVEIKLGGQTTMIDDPELAAALGSMSQAQLRAVLQEAVGPNPERHSGSAS